MLHPMMVAPITFGLLIYTGTSIPENPHLTFFIAFCFSTLLAIATVIYLKKQGIVSDMDVSIREQRVQPLVYGTIYCGVGFLLLKYLNALPLVQGLMFCYAINTAIVWFITREWKISIHAIGLSGPLVALWLHGFHYPIIMGITLVLLCISRVILKAHTPAQVIVGSGLAMSLAYFELTILFL
jgi:membrane-associated phospholipid phosphatase